MVGLPQIGDLIAGYRVDAALGEGGMGAVYRATELSLGRTVALKVIADDLAASDAFRERFEREARVAASLEHPHVVPIYSAGEDRGRPYIAMRLIPGRDARMVVVEDGPLAIDVAVGIVEQVASALDAAHCAGLVHRDVKPANILLGGEPGRPHPYLTDFGIVKDAGDVALTRTGLALGTPAYAAPEQLRGGPVDARTDVFALGGVLRYLVTGRDTDDPAARDRAPGLATVIARAMDPDPSRRYASAGELAVAARRARGSATAPTVARRTATLPAATVAVPPASRRRRVPAVMLTGVAVAVAGVLAAVVLASEGDRAPAEAAPAAVTQVVTQDVEHTRTVERTRTVETPVAAPAVALATWPHDHAGWTVVLASASTRAEAQDRAQKAIGVGRGTPGVLRSSDFASLTPGYWVAYAGSFASKASADSALPAYSSGGFAKAFVRRISDSRPADPSSFGTGRSAGETYSAARCEIGEGNALVCWTPNDGFTLVLASGGAMRVRSQEALHRGYEPDTRTYAPGTRWSSGGYVCISASDALTCTNAAGRGFRLPRYRGMPTYF